MEEVTSKEISGQLKEDFYPEPLPWVEKNGFAHWAIAFGWAFIGLILFQLLASIIALIIIIPTLTDVSDVDAVMVAVQENLNATFIANSLGQFFIIGLASYLVARIHSVKGRHHQFLRLQKGTQLLKMTGLSILLLVSSWGVVSLLGWLNYSFFEWLIGIFPSLNFFKDMQSQMLEMITGFIKTDNSIFYGLIYIALVPSIFEEIMFRGYIQRALEKSWGIWAAIIVSGFIFGAYHIQPSNLLPLAFLGIIFAYVTYITNSLYPAMILHFINNGSQVVYGALNPEFLEATEPTGPGLPWYLLILSIGATLFLAYTMFRIKSSSEHELV
ncbi:MAG: CPBP family intramembrane metalloprotease [Balneolales bacterium]|nr:CPBP family intramembrane metalloprotease [Balneolales bacterium]